MSLPLSPKPVSIEVELTASDAEQLAREILRMLECAHTKQAEDPQMHWDSSMRDSDGVAYYTVMRPVRIGDHVQLNIVPDKRHKGCSGYCHY